MSISTSAREFTEVAPLTWFQKYLLGVLTLLVAACGLLAANVWRAMESFKSHEVVQLQELKDFHVTMLDRIEHLVENSDALTSGDLCLIRFRLRYENRRDWPSRDVLATLASRDGDPWTRSVYSHNNGTLEFGLVPPGGYRLTVQMPDGYTLDHSLDVLPGVPVDRVVFCPRQASEVVATHIELPMVSSLGDRKLVVACFVESDAVALDEWTWSPTERAGRWVAATIAGHDPQSVSAIPELGGEIAATFPYRFGRLTRIAVFQQDQAHSGQLTRLATFQLNAGPDDACVMEPSAIPVDVPPLHYTWPAPELEPVWTIELPEPVAARLAGFIELTTSKNLSGREQSS